MRESTAGTAARLPGPQALALPAVCLSLEPVSPEPAGLSYRPSGDGRGISPGCVIAALYRPGWVWVNTRAIAPPHCREGAGGFPEQCHLPSFTKRDPPWEDPAGAEEGVDRLSLGRGKVRPPLMT